MLPLELLIRSNPAALSLLAPALISGGLALYSFANRRVRGSRMFAFLMLGVFIWSVAYGAELSSLRLEDMMFWAVFEYVGIASIPVVWLLLVLLYTGREKAVTVRNVILLMIVPVITVAMVATNGLHHLYYSAVSIDESGPFPMLALDKGVWFWVHTVYSYLSVLISMVFLIERLRHPRSVYRKQVIALLVGSFVPWLVNIIYVIFNFMPLRHLDLTPYGFTVTGIVIAWAMYRYQLFDIAPIARDRMVENLDDAIIVLDEKERVVDVNKAAHRIMGWSESVVGKPSGAMLARWPDLLELVRTGTPVKTELKRVDKQKGDRYYEVSLQGLSVVFRDAIGKTIMMHDITDRKLIEEELKENEEKYHSFFRTSRDAVFMTTIDGQWV
ncbi:MAG TPA: histidine kinase N-terminal 7TM domain-containing protein, partial [Dissulfurispiraceae bacterium]|nr:histidine kinase N-terminal 7TM domain-containing protein [Dissulfurispiraceae bacterium]